MKIIKLTKNQEILVDDNLFDYLTQWNWHASKSSSGNRYYACRDIRTDFGQRLLRMHHLIWWKIHPETTGHIIKIDHKDGNSLNNRVSNLRVASTLENNRNSIKTLRINCTSQYKGVRKAEYFGVNKHTIVWKASISAGPLNNNGKRSEIYLGRYKTEIEAAIAYDNAACQYFGEFASINFPTR